MSIQFRCSCGKQLRVEDQFAGRKVLCPACKAQVLVPSVAERLEEVAPVTFVAEAPVPVRKPPRRSRREEIERAPVWPWVTGALFLVLLAAGGIGAYFFFNAAPQAKREAVPSDSPAQPRIPKTPSPPQGDNP